MKTLSCVLVTLTALALFSTSCKKSSPAPYVITGGYWVYHSDTIRVKSSKQSQDYQSLDVLLMAKDSTGDNIMVFDWDTAPPNGRCAIGTYGDRTVSISLTMGSRDYHAVYTSPDDDIYVQWPKNRGTYNIQGWTVKFVNVNSPADSLRIPFNINQLN